MTYSVPASKYSSTIDQAAADKLAQLEIKANGQAFANNDESVACIIDTDPFWRADEAAVKRCQQNTKGKYKCYQEVYMTDINPNSASYNSKQWKDIGENTAECPANTPGTVYAKLSYENIYYLGTQTFADVVVRFYSDAACTQPVSINNLAVDLYDNCSCSGNGVCAPSHQYVRRISGSYGILLWNTPVYEYVDSYTCSTFYFLSPRQGYVIVY
jgi:hypothetical protein